MSIGFVGSKAADVEALLSNFRLTEVVIGEGGTVTPIDPPVEEIEITANAEYDEESGNINVSWTSNKQDGIFDILMSEDGENFVSVGTVENASEFVYAPENDFEMLYFKVVQTVGDKSAESNVVAVAKSAEDIAISAEAAYDEESGKITVSWTSNKENGTFEVFVSEDGENFTSADIVEDVTEFIYSPNDEFEILYFKVRQTIGESSAESNVATVNYPINWEDTTDTDNDGLADVYEKYQYKTDPTNPDTDDDGLPDGYEVYYLGTDPIKVDTDDNGISDADEDFDEDGLSNVREYELGTDPKVKDSDYDELTDGEEINYNTDPLKYDTDGDGVSDGDEIALGLNPNNPTSDGTSDSERTFEQHIEAESTIFTEINTDENPFTFSIDITAAGVAENNLYSQESGYFNIMKNEAIVGIVPEFFYAYDLKIDDIVVNFDIKDSVISNKNGKYTSVSDEFVGIKRFNVFKYFEDNNMLLPVETFHDIENNRVYAHTDEPGTYCLIDMEIWLDNLGIVPSTSQVQKMLKTSNDKNIDVIFVIYSNNAFLKYIKSELSNAVTDIFNQVEKQNVNARIHFVTWTGGIYKNITTGTSYAENIDDATQMINNTPAIGSALEPTTYMLTKAVNGIRNNMSDDYLENSEKYCFVIDGGCNPACSTINYGIDDLKEQGMDFSFVYTPGCANINNYDALSSNNSIYQMVAGNGRLAFSEFVYKHIFDDAVKIISSSGLVELPGDFGEISLDSEQDYDNDGLLDVEEIYFDAVDKNEERLVTINDDGTIALPSFNKCVSVSGTYIREGLKRFYDEADESILSELDNIMVLPIMSDPTSEDGDGDGILDFDEFRILKEENGGATEFSSFSYYADSDGDGISDDYEKKIKGLKATRKDTVESLFPNLNIKTFNILWMEFETSTKNVKTNPIYLDVKGNTINVIVRLHLLYDEGYNNGEILLSDGKKYNAKELIEDGIKERWETSFKGTEYDFYPGMDINFNVKIIEIENLHDNKIVYHVFNRKPGSSDDEYDASFTPMDGWNVTKCSETFIYTGDKNDTPIYTPDQYKGVAAHEFGHSLGLMDAYNHKVYGSFKGKIGFLPSSIEFSEKGDTLSPEIWANSNEIMHTYNCGDIMMYSGRALPNNVEMVIEAFSNDKIQSYSTDGQGVSPAIRSADSNAVLFYQYVKNGQLYITFYKYVSKGKYKPVKIEEINKKPYIIDGVSNIINDHSSIETYYKEYVENS